MSQSYGQPSMATLFRGIYTRLSALERNRSTGSGTPTGTAGGDLAGTYPSPTLGAGLDREGSASLVVSELLVTPQSTNYNGYAVKAHASWDGTQDYGEAQAFQLFRTDNTSNENTYGSGDFAPNRDIIYRVDGYDGGVGIAGGMHVATGLRQHAGFAATQGIWVQNFQDMVGIVVTGDVSDGQTQPYLLAQKHSGDQVWQISAHGQEVLSSQGADWSGTIWSRGTGTAPTTDAFAILNHVAGAFTPASGAGDLLIRVADSSKVIRIGVGDGSAYSRLRVHSDKVVIGFDDVSASGRLAGALGFFGLRHDSASADAIGMNAAGEMILQGASDAAPILLGIGGALTATVKSDRLLMAQQIDMGSNKVTSLAAPTTDGDALRRAVGLLGSWFAIPNFGNNAVVAATANTMYYAQVVVPHAATLTGASFSCTTTLSGNAKVGLYDSGGTRLRDGTSTALTTGANKVPFTSTVTVEAGVYFVGIVCSAGSSHSFSTCQAPSSSTAVGSFATAGSITPPTALGAVTITASTY